MICDCGSGRTWRLLRDCLLSFVGIASKVRSGVRGDFAISCSWFDFRISKAGEVDGRISKVRSGVTGISCAWFDLRV